MENINIFFKVTLIFLLTGFPASAQVIPGEKNPKSLEHTFYVAGNIGNNLTGESRKLLKAIVESSKNDKEATLLVPGNFLPSQGFPKNDTEREAQKQFLKKNLLDVIQGFNGKVVFTPGKNEWTKGGQNRIDDLESFLQDNQSNVEVWPDDGCPIEQKDITDDLILVTVDTQWYLENWDDHPNMNSKCDIKSRERFFAEFKDDIKDAHGKTILVSLQHPVMSNSKRSFIEKIGGFSPQDYQNKEHSYLRGRLETLASQFDNVIFASGLDGNLQYLEDDGIPQIISGSAGKKKKLKIRKYGHFGSTKTGYAKLKLYKNNETLIEFFEIESSENPVFSKTIKSDEASWNEIDFKTKEEIGDTISASIYTEEETDKSGFYKSIFGDFYRDVYSKKIKAPVLFLDTLEGNLEPLKEGGGMQSRSLRFIGEDKHEFTIRAMRKSAARFLQATAIKDHYIKDYVENTVAQRYAMDLFTSAHPYARYSLKHLNDLLNIYAGKPEIFYVPKQRALGLNNDEYGDELYMFEAHVGDENKEFERFGSPEDILSTTDLLEELRESKDAVPDEKEFIKNRLVDMLIGDWDRHFDQWRWAEHSQPDGTKLYKPIPRDRDFAFPNYDGFIPDLVKLGLPMLRKMETYSGNVNNVKWFNLSGYPLDQRLLKTSDWEDWKKQVSFIQSQLTDEEIETAFKALPEAAQDESIEKIKTSLKARRDNLRDIAERYYKYLQKFQVLTGTEEDDIFNIERKENGITEIVMINEDGKEIFKNSYNSEATDEIWIYGLDGEDTFKVTGEGNKPLRINVIGGGENDIYDFDNTRKIKIYDHKSKENTIKNPKSRRWLVDAYDINTFDPDKRKRSENKIMPQADYNGDEGLSLGLMDIYTTYGLANNPFSIQHTFKASYFFATNGFEIGYRGEFAHIFYNWNLGIEARYTSPNFAINYFGEGINSENLRDSFGRDYNRVLIEQWEIAPSLIWRGRAGGSFYAKPMVQSRNVSFQEDKFIADAFSEDNDLFNQQLYAGAEVNYRYENRDNPSYPTRGFEAEITTGYKTNIDGHNNEFAYVSPLLAIDYPLHESGIAVLATKVGGKAIIGDNYEYYDGAILGGNENLRAYRWERFNGKQSFFHSTDLRVGVSRFKTNFIPLQIGVSAGFDYGRVWAEDSNSDKWRNNYGGSIWINGFSAITANTGYYYGDDGGRLTFSFNFKF
ncbi:metallophosphatase [Salegentibacter sp. JZCK2]|uniref:BamA/TamA family outer membrane protein n=1 Tax=Salegentibacter tibetensis TaxID=2873600 RepID=UPI001CCFFCD6|nr:metallophosphatase [Salegentibacter tibetensis]MBZ9729963.1 metallophosphatase [Salegentibacter tibetensis]